MLNVIDTLKAKVCPLLQETKAIQESFEIIKNENKSLKKKLNEILKIDEAEISKDNNCLNTFWTNEESNFSEDFDLFNERKNNEERVNLQTILEKEQALREKVEK